MGAPSGSKMHVWEHVAKELLRRGACEILDDKFEAKEEVAVEEDIIEEKAIEKPNHDKMVKKATKSKGFV